MLSVCAQNISALCQDKDLSVTLMRTGPSLCTFPAGGGGKACVSLQGRLQLGQWTIQFRT